MRGNPSRIKEAEESIEWAEEEGSAGEEDDEDVAESTEDAGGGRSQPLDFISSEIKFRIIESGTRLPDCIAASASRPVIRLEILAPYAINYCTDAGSTYRGACVGAHSLSTDHPS